MMCLAMVAMLIPDHDPLGPLIWAILLGGLGVWVADRPRIDASVRLRGGAGPMGPGAAAPVRPG